MDEVIFLDLNRIDGKKHFPRLMKDDMETGMKYPRKRPFITVVEEQKESGFNVYY